MANSKDVKKVVNEVIFKGFIVHKFTTDKVTILTIATGRNNYPQVKFFDSLKDPADAFEVGEHVSIKGFITSIKKTEYNKHWELQFITGTSCELSPNVMETAFNESYSDKHIKPRENMFRVSGEVVRAGEPRGNVAHYLVKTSYGSFVYFITISQYLYNNSIRASVGDQINTVGRVQTVKRYTDDGTKYYTNYVASSLDVVKE